MLELQLDIVAIVVVCWSLCISPFHASEVTNVDINDHFDDTHSTKYQQNYFDVEKFSFRGGQS